MAVKISDLTEVNDIDSTSYLVVDDGTITSKINKDNLLKGYAKKSELGSSGGSGVTSYNDLTDKPVIPSKTSDLVNDSNFATQTYVNESIANASLGNGGSGLSDLNFMKRLTNVYNAKEYGAMGDGITYNNATYTGTLTYENFISAFSHNDDSAELTVGKEIFAASGKTSKLYEITAFSSTTNLAYDYSCIFAIKFNGPSGQGGFATELISGAILTSNGWTFNRSSYTYL